MRKSYEEPVITVRKYQLKSEDVVMTSDPSNNKGNDLFDDSEYDVFGKLALELK